MERSVIQDRLGPGLRGIYHRPGEGRTRWLHPDYEAALFHKHDPNHLR